MVEHSSHPTDVRPGRNPFSERPFLDAWWHYLRKGRPQAVPQPFEDGLMTKVHPLGPRIVEMAGSGAADMLAPGDWTSDEVMLSNLLKDACGGPLGDAIHIARMDGAAPFSTRLITLARNAGLSVSCAPYDVAPYAALPEEWSTFQKRRSAKTWSQLRRKRKRLGDYGDVEIELVEEVRSSLSVMEDLFSVYEARSEAVYRGPLWLSENGRAFLRSWMENLGDQGRLDLSILRIDGAPIAFVFGIRAGQAFYLYATAFDPRHPSARFRPGEVLVADVLERTHRSGVRWFDFLLGDEPYKYEWTDRHRRIDSVIIARNPAIVRLLSAGQAGRMALRRAARHIPVRLKRTLRGVM